MRSLLKVIKQGSADQSDQVVIIPDRGSVQLSAGQLDSSSAHLQSSDENPIYSSLIQRAKQENEALSQRMLQLAHDEREEILRKAAADSEEIKAQAHRAGLAQGLEEKKAEVDAVLKNLNRAVAEVKAQQQQYFEDYSQQLQEFALEIAGKILQQQVTADPTALKSMVVAAVKSLKDTEWITVKLSGQTQELVKLLQRDELLLRQTGARRLDFLERELPAGSCIIETPTGTVDASIETQLRNLKEAFRQE